ncbi:hypothetical protein J5N97_001362 [Dioscorea zingiberensis]|uniref:Uncharacterized protein n=1 Tax=Dioscorea zingiberensis TaxID=325984 RepID=A0A9D5BU28_9LILI|nr:hypothetical protein J5N97_001362 [Dioscorea zingiberensis]
MRDAIEALASPPKSNSHFSRSRVSSRASIIVSFSPPPLFHSDLQSISPARDLLFLPGYPGSTRRLPTPSSVVGPLRSISQTRDLLSLPGHPSFPGSSRRLPTRSSSVSPASLNLTGSRPFLSSRTSIVDGYLLHNGEEKQNKQLKKQPQLQQRKLKMLFWQIYLEVFRDTFNSVTDFVNQNRRSLSITSALLLSLLNFMAHVERLRRKHVNIQGIPDQLGEDLNELWRHYDRVRNVIHIEEDNDTATHDVPPPEPSSHRRKRSVSMPSRQAEFRAAAESAKSSADMEESADSPSTSDESRT